MARVFDGINDFLARSSAVVTAPPFTISAWFFTGMTGATQNISGVSVVGSPNNDRFTLGLDVGNSLTARTRRGAGTNFAATTANAFIPNAWNHGLGIWRGIADRTAILNRDLANEGNDSGSAVPAGINQTNIASRSNNTTQVFNGSLGLLSIWDIDLNDNAAVALADGSHPLSIRRDRLVECVLLMDDGDIDLLGNGRYSITGAPTVDSRYPPVSWPHSPVVPHALAPVTTDRRSVDVSATLELAAGAVVRLRVQQTDGSDSLATVVDGSSLTLDLEP